MQLDRKSNSVIDATGADVTISELMDMRREWVDLRQQLWELSGGPFGFVATKGASWVQRPVEVSRTDTRLMFPSGNQDSYWSPLTFSCARRQQHYAHDEARVAWVDIDTGDRQESWIYMRCEELGLPQPSYRVNTSFGRWQLLWALDGPETAYSIACINRGLAVAFDGDRGAVDVCRMLRQPFSVNFKRENPWFVRGWPQNEELELVSNARFHSVLEPLPVRSYNQPLYEQQLKWRDKLPTPEQRDAMLLKWKKKMGGWLWYVLNASRDEAMKMGALRDRSVFMISQVIPDMLQCWYVPNRNSSDVSWAAVQ